MEIKNGIGEITDIAFSPNNQHLYVTTTTVRRLGIDENWDDKVHVWDVHSAQQIKTFKTEFHGLGAIYLSPDGDTVLLQYADDVVLWDIEKKQRETILHNRKLSTGMDGITMVNQSVVVSISIQLMLVNFWKHVKCLFKSK